jgi:DNA-binding transcriptional MerR regulator
MPIHIGEVAQRTGLSIDTIRFYEKQSLLSVPKRTAAGYRLYEQPEIERLQFISRAQGLGFSLQEIHELLLIEGGTESSCLHVRDLIAAKIAQVREKMAELQRLQTTLTLASQQCENALLNECNRQCPVLKQLKPESANEQ